VGLGPTFQSKAAAGFIAQKALGRKDFGLLRRLGVCPSSNSEFGIRNSEFSGYTSESESEISCSEPRKREIQRRGAEPQRRRARNHPSLPADHADYADPTHVANTKTQRYEEITKVADQNKRTRRRKDAKRWMLSLRGVATMAAERQAIGDRLSPLRSPPAPNASVRRGWPSHRSPRLQRVDSASGFRPIVTSCLRGCDGYRKTGIGGGATG